MLTVKQIGTAKPEEEPCRLLDGNGPCLCIPVSGKKVWQLRYKTDGKGKIPAVEEHPLMALQETKDKVWTARKGISAGIDPVKAKKALLNNSSLSVIYEEWYEHKRRVWPVSYVIELAKMFDDDILPIIGGLEIQDIEPIQLPEVIRRSEDCGAVERVNKACRRCGEVFRYVVVTGETKYSSAPDLADAMKRYRGKNFPLLPANQIPAFNEALATFSGGIISLIATKVLCYTALGVKGLRPMPWKNVDLENRTIAIDASIIRGRKVHVIPVSNQVAELLTTLSPIAKPISEFVFAERDDKKRSIRENTVLLVVKQIGYEGLESGHRFRHEFNMITDEHEWPVNAIEVQLTRADGGFVRGIYNHAQYLDKCKETVQWWAD